MPRLPPATQEALDQAISEGAQPFSIVRGDGQGLYVRAPGLRRAIKLFRRSGTLSPAGEYFFKKRATAPPDRTYDGAQAPLIAGAKETIALRDGSRAATRTFHRGEWRFTALGRRFYADKRTTWLVYFPTDIRYTHTDTGKVYFQRDQLVESTATPLGALSIPSTLSRAEQEAEVRRRVQEFVAGLVPDEGEIVLASDYYHDYLLRKDWEDKLEVRVEEVSRNADGQLAVDALARRPLQAGRPWLYADRSQHAMADAAFEETDGKCVAHQLLQLARRGDQPVWTAEALDEALQRAWEKLYKDDDPYEGESWRDLGVTAAMAIEVCREQAVPLYIVWKDKQISRFTPERCHHTTAMAMVVEGTHAYFLDDAKTKEILAREDLAAPRARPSKRVAIEKKRARVPEASWRDLSEELVAGETYRATPQQLHELRAKLHSEGVVPKVRMANAKHMAALDVPIRRQKDTAQVVMLPDKADQCRRFAELFAADRGVAFPYMGESREALTQRALEHLLKPPPRRAIAQEAIASILARQGNKCAVCSDPLRAYEIDHCVARSAGGGDDLENLRACCPGCHVHKSALESGASVADDNPLRSRFNRETYQAFHLSRKPPQIVANLGEYDPSRGPVVNIDVMRCRFNGFMQLLRDIPVFSPLDDIQAFSGRLGDYNWLTGCRVDCPLRALPFWGAGWHGRASCEFLLDHGIITSGDIQWVFTASAHIPAAFLQERLAILEGLWREAGDAKGPLNALFGLWAKIRTFRYECHTTEQATDVLFDGKRLVRKAPDGMLHDVITETEILSYASMRPLHQLTLEQERMHLARILFVLRQFGRPRLLSIQVDGVFAQVGARLVPKVKEAFEAITYANIGDLRRRWLPLAPARELPGTDQPVYRVTTNAALQLPGGELSISTAALDIPPLAWRSVYEAGDGFYEGVIRPHIMSGKSARIEGPPGMGKSWVLKRVKHDLEAAGEQVAVIAPYHVAARQLGCGARTCHSFVHRFVMAGSFRGTVLLDEYFVVSPEIASALEHCTLHGTRIICFGDSLQLPTIKPSWRGRPVSETALHDSRMLKLWCDCTDFRLTTYRRGTDRAFADWFIAVRQMPAPDAVAEARRRFPPKPGHARWNLTMSHFRRRQINESIQALLARGQCTIRVTGGDAESQDYDCFVGTRLIGCNSIRPGITNGALLTVTAVSSVECSLRDDETGERTTLPLKCLNRHTRLGHAMTLPAAQGRTLEGRVRLWDIESAHVTPAHIYVAASRATAPELFEVM
ncbi:MAG: hypothetical protein B7Z80_12935 [Rhodospirillales bacterium 20-64-7]|nr:MAG: hypothetical protein B7Z80_12935 [Rhodospirillales bacterium 20-64-7]